MAATEWYKDWFNSPYYHKLYFERNEIEAAAFVARLLQHLKPPPGSRLLDVACGRGRHSLFLAERDYDVTGVDLSPDSIHYAQQFEKENLHFYVHDMRLPFWMNYFDIAFNFFTSFGYFRTRREHDDAVRTVATSLKPGGTVVFDYLNTHYTEDRLQHNEEKKIGDTTYEIHRWQNDTHFFKRIVITDPQLQKPLEYTEQVAKFSLGDFNDMLSFQQMQVTDVFGDYALKAYDTRKTPRLIIAAKKQPGRYSPATT